MINSRVSGCAFVQSFRETQAQGIGIFRERRLKRRRLRIGDCLKGSIFHAGRTSGQDRAGLPVFAAQAGKPRIDPLKGPPACPLVAVQMPGRGINDLINKLPTHVCERKRVAVVIQGRKAGHAHNRNRKGRQRACTGGSGQYKQRSGIQQISRQRLGGAAIGQPQVLQIDDLVAAIVQLQPFDFRQSGCRRGVCHDLVDQNIKFRRLFNLNKGKRRALHATQIPDGIRDLLGGQGILASAQRNGKGKQHPLPVHSIEHNRCRLPHPADTVTDRIKCRNGVEIFVELRK